ncbi:hypothetical protein BV898_15177 [Hypsibius exemplaris]|uniref:Uncharacterized protein n=1 Tax=Hypsibius exemplaris TaxID=2072580 RepID=A0A9X6NAI5_HYPEX|nr:hypothetical protein BV898_15177 [Hypsibius exemplaris]
MEAVPELQALFDRLQMELYGPPDPRLSDLTETENAAGAFTTTGSKCLDFFATVVRDTSVETVLKAFRDAWNESPEKAVKLLLNLRDIRGGKGEKKVSLVLLYALSCWKPLTYLANLQRFIDVGCYKDLLFIAELATRTAAAEITQFERVAQLNHYDDVGTAVELKILACQLLNDEQALKEDEMAGISLCAKWTPTENTHFDRQPLRFARKISKAMGVKKPEYRKRVSALRAHLAVLERLMCTGQYDDIIFRQLPAKAHRQFRKAFGRVMNKKRIHSDDRVGLSMRYDEYLAQLTEGKDTIKSTGTQPHELVKVYLSGGGGGKDLTIEGQWKDMMSKLAESGRFKHTQAVCDVSDSMAGTPMQVAIALGLVVAELTAPPFRNQIITFSAQPVLHTIKGRTLCDRVADLRTMPWGSNTDLLKVFDLILRRAKRDRDAPMIEQLFIFTDMQFDEAKGPQARNWETTYQIICAMFEKAKFAVPKIVFWNLRATGNSFPVQKDQAGTALLSGFSAQMMKAFLAAEDTSAETFNPVAVMNAALEKYDVAAIFPVERTPVSAKQAGVRSAFPRIQLLVEEFMVAKKVPKKKKVQPKKPVKMRIR